MIVEHNGLNHTFFFEEVHAISTKIPKITLLRRRAKIPPTCILSLYKYNEGANYGSCFVIFQICPKNFFHAKFMKIPLFVSPAKHSDT